MCSEVLQDALRAFPDAQVCLKPFRLLCDVSDTVDARKSARDTATRVRTRAAVGVDWGHDSTVRIHVIDDEA
jgi:hypothetical protein